MTILTIPAILPTAPANTNCAAADTPTETHAISPSFSSVLTDQQSTKPAAESAVAINGSQVDTTKSQNNAIPETDKKEAADEALQTQLPTEQGQGLPQIALIIAAEAALATTRRQPASASRVAQPQAHQPSVADLAQNALQAVQVDRPKADLAHKIATQTRHRQDASPKTALPALETHIAANDWPATLAAGLMPVQAAPAALHQTQISTRKPINLANIKPALPHDLERAGGPSLGKATASDTSASLAAPTTKTAIFTTAQADPIPLQAGTVVTGGVSGMHTALFSNNAVSTPSTGVQLAIPGIATPLQSEQWSSDFGRQFISLAKGGHNMPHTAELRLDPPELGPLRISININDNVAHAIFTSPHAAVRQTVESSLPQLQQLLAQAGISLGQTSVNDQGQQESAFNESFGAGRGPAMATAASSAGALDAAGQTAARSRAPDALVDTFA